VRRPFRDPHEPGAGGRRGVVDQRVHVVGFVVELSRLGCEVRADFADDLFAAGGERVVEHATAAGGDESRVDVRVPYDAYGLACCRGRVPGVPASTSTVFEHMIEHVSRYRLYPTPAQEILLLEQSGYAR